MPSRDMLNIIWAITKTLALNKRLIHINQHTVQSSSIILHLTKTQLIYTAQNLAKQLKWDYISCQQYFKLPFYENCVRGIRHPCVIIFLWPFYGNFIRGTRHPCIDIFELPFYENFIRGIRHLCIDIFELPFYENFIRGIRHPCIQILIIYNDQSIHKFVVLFQPSYSMTYSNWLVLIHLIIMQCLQQSRLFSTDSPKQLFLNR